MFKKINLCGQNKYKWRNNLIKMKNNKQCIKMVMLEMSKMLENIKIYPFFILHDILLGRY